jgi:cytochrome bd ubiquinol oxidase subunit II
MLATISHLALQQYWWIIISLLGSLLVFLLFIQGGQTLIYTLGKTETERTLIVNTLGRKWELTFTTLVTFGGAFFASFPLFYSTSFGGAYWVWIAILFCFIIQAISYEYRSKPNNFLGKTTYDAFLFINGAFGTILLGTAVGTFFTGSAFTIDKMHLLTGGNPVISRWESSWHGLEAVLNVRNVALGLAVLFLARILGILYIMRNVDNENIATRSKKQLLYNAIPFLVFFLYFTIALLVSKGYAYQASGQEVSLEPYKYLHNFLQMPIVLILFLVGVILVLYGIIRNLFLSSTGGIWYSSIGTVLTVFALFMVAGLNHTAFYPSNYDLQSSLTIENSSSSIYTLKAMSYVSIFVPFVVAYIWYTWYSLAKKKIDVQELESESHVY